MIYTHAHKIHNTVRKEYDIIQINIILDKVIASESI